MLTKQKLADAIYCHAPYGPGNPCDEDCKCASHFQAVVALLSEEGIPMSDRITAPWTAVEVDALNAYQQMNLFHPFTCPGHEGGGSRDLVATRKGWICCHCSYTQNWAHRFMSDPKMIVESGVTAPQITTADADAINKAAE